MKSRHAFITRITHQEIDVTLTRKSRRLAFALSLILGSGTGAAHAGGWYAGLGAGQSKVPDIECDPLTVALIADESCAVDDTDTGLKLFVGYRINPGLALELSAVDLGEAGIGGTDSFFGATGLHTDVSGISLSVLGFLPVTRNVALFGRAGAFRWDADTTFSSDPGEETATERGTDPMVGAGILFGVSGRTDLRIEWERFLDVAEDTDIDLVSASIVFRF